MSELNKIQKAMIEQEFLDEIGDLSQLQTTDKSSLKNAINETVTQLAEREKSVTQFSTIQEAFDNAKNIYFPDGFYDIATTIEIKSPNTKVSFGSNVILRAVNGIKKIFNNTNMGEFVFDGKGAKFDLNETADYVISVNASVVVQDINISNVYGFNRSDTTNKWESAIEIRKCKDVVLDNIKIVDYANLNVTPGEESYGLGIFFSQSVKVTKLNIQNAFIGVLIQDSPDVQIESFSLTDIKDNGVYVLGNSPDVKITKGVITNAEEGVVTYSDRTIVDNVTFISNTNKGITLRKTNYSKFSKCIFINCKTAIGDDGTYESSYIDIEGNTIIDCTEYSIYLRKLTHSRIANNDVTSSVATLDIIRLTGSTLSDNVGNIVSNNRFNDANKTSSSCVTFTGGEGSLRSQIKGNTFVKANVAVKLFRPSGTGCINNFVIDNIYQDVTTNYANSGGLTNTFREIA
ncbi:right-handed parallel beta-helix repeat-containing protein [Metabacillus arenae]|uniref:Right-handed parallel beta-helix repeat-containing protein n=1 Tax=Metabacillus arenae TaxID=2771434 RepID=A0A926N882_9BACI|nr:right-handed parallel beta-helix repeat-containing protein [Metabacillus arenae]MBD1379222.1 right-handed parallel beta-helix repeat-containing protein [Metabacillus arenae]